MTYPTIEHVAMQARPYPTRLLERAETGLVLFAAAFLGHNDAIWFALNNVRTTFCVDVDRERLDEMRRLYPQSWTFLHGDAWEHATRMWAKGFTFDVVSVDTFTGAATQRSLDSVDLWCSLARRAVTMTITTDETDPLVPDGWKWERFERAHDVFWLVLERE